MGRSARAVIDTRGRRLALAGVTLAFACGFAGYGASPIARGTEARPGTPGTGAGDITAAVDPFAPALAAAHPDLAAPAATMPASIVDGAMPVVTERPSGPPASSVPPVRPRTFPVDDGALAWRAVHGAVDGGLWHGGEPASDEASHGRGLAGIGFPAIARSPGEGMRVYRPLVAWHDAAEGRVPLAHVRCMGLSPAAVARRAARYERLIVELAMARGISASLVKAVITEESCFDPNAVSHAGAIGLMQLMPDTAKWLRITDPRVPEANLRAGIRYLAMLKERYGDTALALAAYNAGPGNVQRYGGVPPFAETRRYVERVQAHHRRYVAATALAAR